MKLIFTNDQMPGYKRIRRGKGFSFLYPDGNRVTDRDEIQRIMSLAIPPAYEEVWICMLPHGHLQATGMDARRRKQYRYHPLWHEDAADRKFGVLTDFARALPRIRASLRKELSNLEITRERVIAGIVSLLDHTGYRIGNSRYVKQNKSYGISSLLARHLREVDGKLVLKFRGKSGNAHHTEIASPHLLRLIADLHDLPGQHLFCYEDEVGMVHGIETTDVNQWIKEVGGGDYTAKQFRTWKATVLCAKALAIEPPPDSRTAQDRVVRNAIQATAVVLNHTVATCRKYYIHPTLIDAYRSGTLFRIMNSPVSRSRKLPKLKGLRADEQRVFQLLFQSAKL